MPEETVTPEIGQSPESLGRGPEAPGTPDAGKESAVESAPERASERYAEMLAQVRGTSGAAAVPASDAGQVEIDAKAIAEETDAEARVRKLLILADAKGAVYAINVAQKLSDFFVLDRTHDELAKKFHEAMSAQGKI